MMAFIRFLNARVKRFNIFDIKLSQGIGIAVALIAVKLIPGLTDLSIWWFVGLLVICSIRPVYILLARE